MSEQPQVSLWQSPTLIQHCSTYRRLDTRRYTRNRCRRRNVTALHPFGKMMLVVIIPCRFLLRLASQVISQRRLSCRLYQRFCTIYFRERSAVAASSSSIHRVRVWLRRDAASHVEASFAGGFNYSKRCIRVSRERPFPATRTRGRVRRVPLNAICRGGRNPRETLETFRVCYNGKRIPQEGLNFLANN